MGSQYREDYREGQREFLWTLPRALGLGAVTLVAVFLLLVVTTPLTIGFGWFRGEANLRSFTHVQQTYQEAFDDAKAMDANAQQACQVQQLIKGETDPTVRAQRQSQLLAIENNYDRVRGEYDAYMEDHFRGGVIHPSQLPLPYPTLTERMGSLC